ncbi:MAG: cell wall-binding repeat-containing protein [Acidimicrobiales bacterium]
MQLRCFTRAMGAVTLATGSALLSFAALSSSTASASTSEQPTFTAFSLAGQDRFASAASVAEETFGSNAATVLVTDGVMFPDALVASYLAGAETGGAPILLTNPDGLPASITQALGELHAVKVVIVGGDEAVSARVQEQLSSRYATSRIAGPNRYDTVEAVDAQVGIPVGTDPGGERTAILVSGTNFPDAVSASALSYARHLPIVLTNPARLSPQAATVLREDHIAHVIAVGGPAAVKGRPA